jgi:cell division protein FtsZ
MRQGPLAELFRPTDPRPREAAAAAGAAAAPELSYPEPVAEPFRRLEAVTGPYPAPQSRADELPYTPRRWDAASYLATIRVVGVGGAGLNAIGRMIEAGVEGVEFIALNTDAQQLATSEADTRLQLGHELTRGLGSGADANVGQRSAEASTDQLRQLLRGSDLVFVAAGQGGGTGTGAAPVVARVARELGALTVGIVTRPFRFEGSRRRAVADAGIQRLQAEVDTLITVPNDRLLEVLDRSTSMMDAFRVADDVLRQGVQGICDLITRPGLINLDFADVRTVMRSSGNALMGIGTATGPSRAADAARRAIDSPLIEHEIRDAKGIILSVAGGEDLSLHEVTEAAEVVQGAASENANIIFGASLDPALAGSVWVTVIATGFDASGSAPSTAAQRPGLRPAPVPAPADDDPLQLPGFLRNHQRQQ